MRVWSVEPAAHQQYKVFSKQRFEFEGVHPWLGQRFAWVLSARADKSVDWVECRSKYVAQYRHVSTSAYVPIKGCKLTVVWKLFNVDTFTYPVTILYQVNLKYRKPMSKQYSLLITAENSSKLKGFQCSVLVQISYNFYKGRNTLSEQHNHMLIVC